MKYPFDSDEANRIEAMRNKMIIGDPKEVKQQLTELQDFLRLQIVMRIDKNLISSLQMKYGRLWLKL
jgi:alkanesulfonate monooxygenase SsuD/methylene tetrahydromethanopterin reductase-like flavin-dependent oxidoreductase (luciferase family)